MPRFARKTNVIEMQDDDVGSSGSSNGNDGSGNGGEGIVILPVCATEAVFIWLNQQR